MYTPESLVPYAQPPVGVVLYKSLFYYTSPDPLSTITADGYFNDTRLSLKAKVIVVITSGDHSATPYLYSAGKVTPYAPV